MKTSFLKSILFFISLTIIVGCEEVYITETGVNNILILSDSGNRKLIGEEVSFQVNTNNGEDVSDEVMFFINDELSESLTFSSDKPGIFQIKAEYLNLEASYELEFHDGTDQVFKKRVLVEDYTGTWCGWCPRLSHAMTLAAEASEDLVFTVIHRAPTGTADPFNFTEAGPLEELINTPGYPKGFINRINRWSFPEPDNVDQVIQFTQGERPKLDFAVNSSINDSRLEIDVNVLFTDDYSDIKLVVYLQENGLVYPQTNYTSHYDGQNPIPDYVHDYTLRACLTDILGDDIPAEEARQGTIFNRDFNFELPEEIEDFNQLDLVVFVVNNEDEVINVRKAKVGEEQEFEFE